MPFRRSKGDTTITFASFGLPLQVTVSSQAIRARIEELLPPGWEPCEAPENPVVFSLEDQGEGKYGVFYVGRPRVEHAQLEVALDVLDAQIRLYVATNAKPWVFVRSGMVVVGGRAVLIPGPSFSGKSSLVAALVRAGAGYGSDEYAVLDPDGLVHPFPRRGSVPGDAKHAPQELTGAELGARELTGPLPVGLVVLTRYRPGAVWDPVSAPPSRGMLGLLSNTVPARARPREAMAAIGRAVDRARVIESDRADAEVVAASLIAALRSR